MSAVFVAALLIAAQASSGSYALATLRPASEALIPPIPQKVGARLRETEDLGPQITAQSATVIDAASGALLFGKRSHEVRPLASITKLLTALVVAESNPDWDAFVEIVTADIPEEGHTVFMPGDRVTARDLFTAMLVYSDNAAARALARITSSDQRNAPDTPLRIVDPAGLSPENRGTAVEAARLLIAALREEEIVRRLPQSQAVIVVERKRGPGSFSRMRIPIRTTNQLLRDGVAHAFAIVGGKTGYLDESGYNLVMAAERNNHRIVIALLGSGGHDDRFRDARVLADWTFQNYVWTSSTSSSGSATSASSR